MEAKDNIIQLVNPYSLQVACENLRGAILRLPHGLIRERLFISLLKIIQHLQDRHFILMQRTLVSMRLLAKDPVVTEEVTLGLMELLHQLRAFRVGNGGGMR